jgi:hypothetical protein
MTRNLLAIPTVAAFLLLGCGPKNNGANSGSESGAAPGGASTMDTTSMPADTGAMRSDTGMSSGMRDTGMMRSDTGMSSGSMSDTSSGTRSGTSGRDSAKGNQTKSGVTNTETGKSTLGNGVTQTRPDQNQPVTSKGDTVSSSAQPNASSDTSSAQ